MTSSKLWGVVAEVEGVQNVFEGMSRVCEPYCHISGNLSSFSEGRRPSDIRGTNISSRRKEFAAVGADDAEGGCMS